MAELAFLILRCALAGSQYHGLAEVGAQIALDDRLELLREAANRHDPAAIAVLWQGRRIGYLPRAINRPLAAALDEGIALHAHVTALRLAATPWQRVELAVYAPL